MPSVNRRTSVQTTTKEGEITINLNLNISFDENGLSISPQVLGTSGERITETRTERKAPEIVPDELFASGDDLIDGFGE